LVLAVLVLVALGFSAAAALRLGLPLRAGLAAFLPRFAVFAMIPCF
jgi:hypothetical protein